MTICLQRRFFGIFYTFTPSRYLNIALIAGYGLFVFCLGLRWVVLLSGGLIVASAIVYECLSASHPCALPDSTNYNLLDPDMFYQYVDSQMPPFVKINSHSRYLAVKINSDSRYLDRWQQVATEMKSIQALAAGIAKHEPTLTPDLIDALYTVVDLGSQFALALQTAHRVKMAEYQAIAQQQLDASQTRIKQTHHQMRSLHDQILIEGLSQFSTASTLSTRLQTLIINNKSGLLQD